MVEFTSLRQRAHDDCLRHAQATFTGELMVELGESDQIWNPVELRHVFYQPMIIWKKYGDFEVILDEMNQPVGYVDHEKWHDCQWQALSRAEVLDIIFQTGMVHEDIVVEEEQPGERGCLEVLFKEMRGHLGLKRFRIQINPLRRVLISILPVSELISD